MLISLACSSQISLLKNCPELPVSQRDNGVPERMQRKEEVRRKDKRALWRDGLKKSFFFKESEKKTIQGQKGKKLNRQRDRRHWGTIFYLSLVKYKEIIFTLLH